MNKNLAIAAGAGIVLAAAGYYGYRQAHGVVPAPVAAAPAVVASAPPPVAASAPAQHYPVASAAQASSAPLGVDDVLAALFGGKTVAALFRTDDFARRFVATVDNLGRSAAPANAWPVQPAGGRFLASSLATGGEVISTDNGLRYAPYVQMLEQVDLGQAVRYYRQLYPSLQQAYQDLGFPQGYFNDRFIAVLDQLLATPEAPWPLHVHRPPIRGDVQPTRPWVLYEFDDPVLQDLSAGQRTLVRMGPVNERRVKSRLAQLRKLLATP